MAKHTLGPWRVTWPPNCADSKIAVTALGGQIDIYLAPLTQETEANARLIAAAPELLEALQDIVAASSAYMKYHAEKFYSATEQPTGLWPAIERANASIAKIKGGHHEILRH